MMIYLLIFLFGALFGAWRAKSREGALVDMVQYGIAHGILFTLAAIFIGLILFYFR